MCHNSLETLHNYINICLHSSQNSHQVKSIKKKQKTCDIEVFGGTSISLFSSESRLLTLFPPMSVRTHPGCSSENKISSFLSSTAAHMVSMFSAH